MSSGSDTPSSSNKVMLWAGRILSAFVVAMLLFSGIVKVSGAMEVSKEFVRLGYQTEGIAMTIGIVEIACALIYAFPPTAVLGAILLTGYLGGATATQVRLGEPYIGPVIGGVLAWLGLFLRDARIRAIVPWRKMAAEMNTKTSVVIIERPGQKLLR